MEAGGVFLRLGIAPALDGDRVQQHRLFHAGNIGEHAHQLVQIVPVDGADVLEAAALEKVVFVEPALEHILDAAKPLAEGARLAEGLPEEGIELAVAALRRHLGDGAVQRGMVFVDAHAVVVEHDDEVFRLRFGGEHRLEGKPVAEGGVADERDHLVAFPAQVARVAVADARRDGGAAVPGDKGVVSAFGGVGEPAVPPCVRSVSRLLPVSSLCT